VKNGRLWVLGLLVLGSCAGVFAVWHWSQPVNAVRWTFTQFHMSLLPGKRKDAARQVAAETVTVDGHPISREDFLASYPVGAPPGSLTVSPCAAAAGHWEARMGDRAWCFVKEGREWKLHRVGRAPCDEK
jgi:hypothetical protein